MNMETRSKALVALHSTVAIGIY